jgi:hypothetical protein
MKPLPIDNLKFPLLCYNQNLVLIKEDAVGLTSCGAGALKNGWFEGMAVIGSDLKCFTIVCAKKLHGIGPFWGYRILLTQRIKVALFINEEPNTVSMATVKERIFQSFKKGHGWSSRDDFEELKKGIQKSQSFQEMVQLLK